MTKQPFRFTFFLLICFSIPVIATAQTQTVNIPDPNLRTAIENELGKASGAAITVADMESLTQLSALIASVSDLTGLEAATNLTDLELESNSISDISPIAELTNLTSLRLNSNSISDISAVAGLTNLTDLELESNSISDISAIAGLTNLASLWLSRNSITDISAVAGLTSLTSLRLNSNFISDISPLVENTGLRSGDWVNVKINLLNAASINTHIPALQRRGVTVEFDNIIVQPGDPDQTVDIPDPVLRAAIGRELGEASGATITGADMARLTSLIRPISFFSSISDLTGLEYAINIVTLGLRGNSISDLSPLSGLTNLTSLSLPENQITDISAVAGLISLTELHLEDNNITDISAIARLTNLFRLELEGNNIMDISAIARLTNLNTLILDNNFISDLSPLVENTELKWVYVNENPLSSLSINTHIPALESRGVNVEFDNIVVKTPVKLPRKYSRLTLSLTTS